MRNGVAPLPPPNIAIVITSDLKVVSEAKVDFDADFGSRYGVKKGVQTNDAEGEVYAPVAMWFDALELVLSRLRDNGCPIRDIQGISGSGQQHGSVFWNARAVPTLRSLDPSRTLREQLADTLAYEFSPNWQDHSTQAECDQFDAHLGGPHKLAEITGSAAHHVRKNDHPYLPRPRPHPHPPALSTSNRI